MDKFVIRTKRTIDLPLCKYGNDCYQTNPEHRKKFKHLSDEVSGDANSLKNSLNDAPTPKVKQTTVDSGLNIETSVATSSTDVVDTQNSSLITEYDKLDSSDLNLESVGDILKLMPKDFFDFWDFCSTMKKNHPEDALLEFGFKLVGIYDLLAKKLSEDQQVDISCHWRFYYDPPEFQTVIMENDSEQFHVGYFRDDPAELPSILASNSANIDCMFKLEGDNLFAAMRSKLTNSIKLFKSKPLKSKAKTVIKTLETYAEKKGYSLDLQTAKTKQRMKKVVAKTFHNLGIVVPIKNDVGYRELPVTNAALKAILKRIISAEDEAHRLKLEEQLDEVVTNVNLANDECDFGAGLELGIDLFCFGDKSLNSYILSILPLAYRLLNRTKYAVIVETHLKNRRKDSKLHRLIIV